MHLNVHHTAESNSAVCIPLGSKSQIVYGIFFTSEVFQKNGVENCNKYENTKNRHIRTSLTPRCASHCEVKLPGVHPTVESSSAVCMTPGSQVIKISQKAPRCAFHCGVKLCSVHPSAESSSSVCITRRSQMAHRGVKIEIFVSLWLLLKGQSREILLGVNTSIIDDNN